MPRLLFEKRGNAIWISHLDLMRVFQRAFKRAGLPLKHTQGFNPRPSVSIALPLSVGIESCCELLDFDLDGESFNNEEIADRLNSALVSGVRVLSVYGEGNKIRNLSYLDCELNLEYDNGIPEGAEQRIRMLFALDEVMVEKKGKNGITNQNIIPLIRQFELGIKDSNTLQLNARVCCQNPTLNPMQLNVAIRQYLPELTPDFVSCCRREVYDVNNIIFR